MEWKAITAVAFSALTAFALTGFGVCPQAMASGNGTDYEWSIDLDCSLCHQKEAESLLPLDKVEMAKASADDVKTAEVSNYARDHTATFGIACTTCHIDSDGLAKGHKKLNSGKEAKRLKKSTVDSEVCTSCHQPEKLVELTADYKGLVDSNGTMVNPHDLPNVDSHTDISCTACHQAHSGKTIDVSAITTCNSCHHAGVFECGTCH